MQLSTLLYPIESSSQSRWWSSFVLILAALASLTVKSPSVKFSWPALKGRVGKHLLSCSCQVLNKSGHDFWIIEAGVAKDSFLSAIPSQQTILFLLDFETRGGRRRKRMWATLLSAFEDCWRGVGEDWKGLKEHRLEHNFHLTVDYNQTYILHFSLFLVLALS